MYKKIKDINDYKPAPSWVLISQDEFGFWDGSLRLDTDPPTESTPEPENTPEPEKTPDPTPEPAKAETTPDPLGEIKDLFKALLSAQKEATPEPTPENTPEPEKTPEPEPDNGMNEINSMLWDLLIEAKKPPEYLIDIIPKNPKEAKAFLESQSYKDLVAKLELVGKPLNEPAKTPETKTEPEKTEPAKPDPSRDNPGEKKPKTFADLTPSLLSDIFKGL